MNKKIYIAILLLPLLILVLNEINEVNALIWLGIDTVYYYPIYLLFGDMFKVIEMGLLIPSVWGRIVGFIFYLAIMIGIELLVRKLRKK